MSEEQETPTRRYRFGFLEFSAGCFILSIAAWIAGWAYYAVAESVRQDKKEQIENLKSEVYELQSKLTDCRRGMK
jgi:hypothetical protein